MQNKHLWGWLTGACGLILLSVGTSQPVAAATQFNPPTQLSEPRPKSIHKLVKLQPKQHLMATADPKALVAQHSTFSAHYGQVTYLDADRTLTVNGTSWVHLTDHEQQGWVKASTVKLTDYDRLKTVTVYNTSRDYGYVKQAAPVYQQPKGTEGADIAPVDLVKAQRVQVLAKVQLTATGEVSTTESIAAVTGTGNPDKDTNTYLVPNVTLATTATDKADTDKQGVADKADTDKQGDADKADTESPYYYKISVNGKTGYVKATDLDIAQYGVTLANVNIGSHNQIGQITTQMPAVYSQPLNMQGSTQVAYSLKTDDFVIVTAKVTVRYDNKTTKWYGIKVNGLDIGYVKAGDVKLISGGLKVQLGTTYALNDIYTTFNLTPAAFKAMNPEVKPAYTAGETIRVRPTTYTYTESADVDMDYTNTIQTVVTGDFLADITQPKYLKMFKDAGMYPSIGIAQAILESGYGQSGLARSGNNYYGVKGAYNGDSVYWDTAEYDSAGNRYMIQAAFRKYPNMSASINDYIKLIHKANYAGAVNAATMEESLAAIYAGGYATSPDYVQSVLKVIASNNLTQYDN